MAVLNVPPPGEQNDYIVTDLKKIGSTSWKCVQLPLRNCNRSDSNFPRWAQGQK